ncbi:hypothetical protein [Listeria cornellensis]|uniref:Lipoprotein n=1 Tax=Listeria cornellensis FSL F6-0969 TaxID=1265820 RepID=W7C4Y8_9LIST|nr:hypothetical protein [Listeria cornellensis]EUJ32162.1 hypothetical protein PCORN_03148 [Listeria cornellensis FSL F6-0969]
MRMRKILLGLTVSLAVAGLVACGTPDKDVAATKKEETKQETENAQVKAALEKLEKKVWSDIRCLRYGHGRQANH